MIVAVFLDRDGTIIEDAHYPKDPKKVKLIPGAVEALHLLTEKGYVLFVVSNQSGVGRGIVSDEAFRQVHARFSDLLQGQNVEIAEFMYCFHHPDDPCHCRKPKTGNIPKTYLGKKIDFSQSYTIGDRESDLQLAENLGARGCLVLTGKGEDTLRQLKESGTAEKYLIASNLLAVAKEIPAKSR